ncbi:PREDICTED: uncharacterized protein LOC108762306 [Trachymyrmex cornetzi]|uniref:uncharacterized protein LOC108762306 n=1 Tax=Trachymyrmex cornetzi TaxID=471704 RepID=UPI00084EFB34|nr:PREDICTED: uncharacterized protein LOC108762306 [Trachymyrmex cornetzi]
MPLVLQKPLLALQRITPSPSPPSKNAVDSLKITAVFLKVTTGSSKVAVAVVSLPKNITTAIPPKDTASPLKVATATANLPKDNTAVLSSKDIAAAFRRMILPLPLLQICHGDQEEGGKQKKS